MTLYLDHSVVHKVMSMSYLSCTQKTDMHITVPGDGRAHSSGDLLSIARGGIRVDSWGGCHRKKHQFLE